jgi:hypothetical protein
MCEEVAHMDRCVDSAVPQTPFGLCGRSIVKLYADQRADVVSSAADLM